MPACPSCAEDNPDRARFCLACGTALSGPAPRPRAVRKTVTVVFSDLAGSTSMGEQLDPESLQAMMARYFDEMRAIVERHGGTVAKFIGDAVMAVFGIPTVREDDALRAVRAAAEMRDVMGGLNDDFERQWGVRLTVRTGVNTGEVLDRGLSEEEGLALGDAVNVAARLEQAAPPGQILIGPETYKLVRDAVRVDTLEPLQVKGKQAPIHAAQLIEVEVGAPAFARRLDSPLVGRREELARLHRAYERAVAERSCQLVTVMGAAGMGKSRLVNELLAEVGSDAVTLSGRCLSYGEGVTFWPMAEICRQAALIADGDDPGTARDKLAAILGHGPDTATVAGLVAQVIGLSPPSSGPEELFWGVRRFVELLAADRPVVVVLDDLHWAEPTMLDLVEHLVDWSRVAPVLVLGTARHELLDTRPAWGAGRAAASAVRLQPLPRPDMAALLANLLDAAALTEEVQDRIIEAAEGIPLFVEEILGMLIDDGFLRQDDGAWVPTVDLTAVPMPPTISALVAGRIERLGAEERTVLDCAAVVGKVFWASSVAELAPPSLRPEAQHHLLALVQRELVGPDRSTFAGHEAYRFRHLLVRDTAYSALPKEDRARLHEALAGWLERVTAARVDEYEGIVGYHLEQAVRLRAELGPATGDDRALAARSATWLGRAGRRALAQDDFVPAVGLLTRAEGLDPSERPERLEANLALADALVGTGALEQADAVLVGVAARARSLGDSRLGAHAAIGLAMVRRSTGAEESLDEAAVEEAIGALRAHDDQRGMALGWLVLARPLWDAGRVDKGDELAATALDHARRAGDTRTVDRLIGNLAMSSVYGTLPTGAALERCEAWATELGGRRVGAAVLDEARALLHAMRGEQAEARAALERCRSTYLDLGMAIDVAGLAQSWAEVERLAGAPAEAEAALRFGYDALEAVGERDYLSTLAAQLAHVLHARGELADAEHYAVMAERESAEDDVVSRAWAMQAWAKVHAARGLSTEAEGVARRAVELVAGTDWRNDHARALVDLADVLVLDGRAGDARPLLDQAVRLYDEKENLVEAAQVRARLAGLERGG